MRKIADLTLSDDHGDEYSFEVYPKESNFDDAAGVYVFTKRTVDQQGKGTHDILYIGETGSFRNRPLDWGHPKWGAATRMGMTHVCVLRTHNRVYIQNRLIAAHAPPLNERELG